MPILKLDVLNKLPEILKPAIGQGFSCQNG
ncbi:uncharacterized protein METZ01_LOCUS158124, partial [marine metagenome]